jgi:CCR4-NOT transcription complex subunit 9
MISFFLTTELVPLCLRVMEGGIEASKTAATATLLKILLDETGLTYICHTQERHEAVIGPLAILVEDVVQKQSIRLLKLVLQCYARLTDDRGYVKTHFKYRYGLLMSYTQREGLPH